MFNLKINNVTQIKEFCNKANECDFDIDVKSRRYVVDAKSIMGIMSLNLSEEVSVLINDEESEKTFIAKLNETNLWTL